jgi:nicotinate-nucleotide pyrophosphorylase (carboxylating)
MHYKQYHSLPIKYIKRKIKEFLKEDMVANDITTINTIKDSKKITAKIQALEELIFVGDQILPYFLNSKCKYKSQKKDGDIISSGDIIGEIIGPSNFILSIERVMLNLIQRLSGIASKTHEYVQIVKNHNIKILDTRKTTPGLRLFEKHAVSIGGGFNHRLDLSKGILIKDNHILSAGSISNAIDSIKKNNFNLPIEIEIDNLKQLKEALKLPINGILLDNMAPYMIKKAVKMIKKTDSTIFIEASGGITKKNLYSFVNTEIDAISTGAITHSAISKDIKLEFI